MLRFIKPKVFRVAGERGFGGKGRAGLCRLENPQYESAGCGWPLGIRQTGSSSPREKLAAVDGLGFRFIKPKMFRASGERVFGRKGLVGFCRLENPQYGSAGCGRPLGGSTQWKFVDTGGIGGC